MSPDFQFRLYLSDRESIESIKVIEDLLHYFDDELGGEYNLDIVDVECPGDMQPSEGVQTTPALMRLTPSPACRVVGDFSSHDLLHDVICPSA